jgi:hypothetical protein
MPQIFGKQLSRREIQQYVPDPSQIASVQRATLSAGRAEGVEIVTFRTGSGFEFVTAPGRALDIVSASYQGVPLHWHAFPGPTHAAYFEPPGMGWLRGYAGGLLTTGGLTYMGSPSTDRGEELGIHGRISYVPASHVWADSDWDGDDYRLWVRGKIAESAALGPHVVMTREISTTLGASHFTIRDTVENRTHYPIEHMMLYHFTIGYPVLSESSRLLMNSVEVVGRDDASNAALDTWDRFEPPLAGREHQLFYHRLQPDADSKAHVVLLGMQDTTPLAVYLSYHQDPLPWFANWKCMQAGDYVTGLEPANAWVQGRAVEREAGRLRFLGPWESLSYEVEFGVLHGTEEITAFTVEHGLPDARLQT